MSNGNPPLTTQVGSDLYDAMEPMAYADEENAWALAHYLDASALAVEEVAGLVRADDEGHDGWSAFADPQRCPDSYLRTLAQWAGVRWPNRMSLAALREFIGGQGSGLWRGTRAAIIAEVRRYMPPGMADYLLYFEERADGDPYAVRIFTYSYVEHDPDIVRAVLEFALPAGLTLEYEVRVGQSWNMLDIKHDSWADVRDSYASWDDVHRDQPI